VKLRVTPEFAAGTNAATVAAHGLAPVREEVTLEPYGVRVLELRP
jgi:hypothetical protein